MVTHAQFAIIFTSLFIPSKRVIVLRIAIEWQFSYPTLRLANPDGARSKGIVSAI